MKKNIAWTFICLVVVSSLTVLSGCEGGGSSDSSGSSDCAAPALDATGTWCMSITSINSTCGNTDTSSHAAVYTQNGNDVTVNSLGGIYRGTICGNTATLTGTNNGFNTTTYVTFSDATYASGYTEYSNGTCSGVDTFTATNGLCVAAGSTSH